LVSPDAAGVYTVFHIQVLELNPEYGIPNNAIVLAKLLNT
jgi:hypothetical protein